MSKPAASSKSKLDENQKVYLRDLARKTWSFFEDYVTAEDNWLPPDNLQQYPIPVVAHRTSPTNIGLSLLANLSAYDFGYITVSQLIERTQNTFATLNKLDRYAGHFYNWYDTQSLHVLNPRYVSTVDSGNLAGHLLTLRQGFLAIPHQPIVDRSIFHGLQDTLRLSINTISGNENGQASALLSLHDSIGIQDIQLPELLEHIEKLLKQFNTIAIPDSNPAAILDSGSHRTFMVHLESVRNEIILAAPWLTIQDTRKIQELEYTFHETPTLSAIAKMDREIESELKQLHSLQNSPEESQWLNQFEQSVLKASKNARERIAILEQLASPVF